MSAGQLALWAPWSARVELEYRVDGGECVREPMASTGQGWWCWDGDPAAARVFDYGFVLDGAGPALPDPRSAWQPQGVHGPSRWFDPTTLTWTDTGWAGPRQGRGALGGVIYELHVGTFTAEGTFDAAADRLADLVELGVDVVELLPIAAFPGDWGWGYDGVAKYAVHDRYGGPVAFARFVDAAHGVGLGVCLDVVHNHLGPSGNYLGRFGPYFTTRHLTPWGPAVNLDADGSQGVRAYFIAQVLRWCREFHVDALRLDAVHALVDTGERHFLAELADAVHDLATDLGRPLELIAESDLNDTVMVTDTAAHGLGMDAQWADDVHHAMHVRLTGETGGYYADFADPQALERTLTGVFHHAGTFSTFRDRVWGRPVDVGRYHGHQFVAYLQTHDQVGNRATGDRIGATLSPGQQAIGAAWYLLSAYTPMIFMGEEWAASTPWQFFTSFAEPELAEAVRAGRRQEFAAHGWSAEQVPDPQDPATRDASVLRWDERRTGEHARMLTWYRELIALRRGHPDLSDPDLASVRVEDDHASHTVVVHRGRWRVVANLAPTPGRVDLDAGVRRVGASFAADESAQVVVDGRRVDLPGHAVAVLEV